MTNPEKEYEVPHTTRLEKHLLFLIRDNAYSQCGAKCIDDLKADNYSWFVWEDLIKLDTDLDMRTVTGALGSLTLKGLITPTGNEHNDSVLTTNGLDILAYWEKYS